MNVPLWQACVNFYLLGDQVDLKCQQVNVILFNIQYSLYFTLTICYLLSISKFLDSLFFFPGGN